MHKPCIRKAKRNCNICHLGRPQSRIKINRMSNKAMHLIGKYVLAWASKDASAACSADPSSKHLTHAKATRNQSNKSPAMVAMQARRKRIERVSVLDKEERESRIQGKPPSQSLAKGRRGRLRDDLSLKSAG